MTDMQTRTDAVVAYLRTAGKDIGQKARGGDVKAQNIVDLYTMLHKRPEPATLGLLEGAIDEWEQASEASR